MPAPATTTAPPLSAEEDFLAPDMLADVMGTPEFAALPFDERQSVVERGLEQSARWMQREHGGWTPESWRQFGSAAAGARQHVAESESFLEKTGSVLSKAGGAVKDALAIVGTQAVGLSPVVPNAEGGAAFQFPGETSVPMLLNRAGALTGGQVGRLVHDEAALRTALDEVKGGLDEGAFFQAPGGLGGWLDMADAAMQEAAQKYHGDASLAETNTLLRDTENARLLAAYTTSRSPQAWASLEKRLMRTPLDVAVAEDRARLENDTTLGQALKPEVRHLIAEASDPAEVIGNAIPAIKGAAALAKGAKAIDRVKDIGKGVAAELLSEQISATIDDPRLTLAERMQVAKDSIISAAGLTAAGASPAALARGVEAAAGAGLRRFATPSESGLRPGLPAQAPDALTEDTGDLTAEDVVGMELGKEQGAGSMGPEAGTLEGIASRAGSVEVESLIPGMAPAPGSNPPVTSRQPILTRVPDRRTAEQIAESQQFEKERQAQVSKLRMLDNQAKGVPMIADSPTGSRDILDFANENPIFLPPGYSDQRKLPEYEALSRNPLPPYWRQFVASGKQGGNPDTIAQRAFDAGLIAEPTADAYMLALQDGIAGRQQYRVQFSQRDKALAQEEKRVVDFEKTQTKLAKKPEAQEVPFEDITPGDSMTIDGEQAVVRNVEYNEDGYLTNVVIEDGKRFGLMQFDPQTRGGLLVDEFKPTSTTASTPATAPAGAPAATSASGGVRANGNGAGASPAMAPAAGEVNLEDLNAELQMAGGLTNFRVDGSTAGFANAQILNEALDLVQQGFTTFANWSKAMVTRFGRGIQEFLAGIWQQVKDGAGDALMNYLQRTGGMKSFVEDANGPPRSPAGATIPEGKAETQSRFASPEQADNLYDKEPVAVAKAAGVEWLDTVPVETALEWFESASIPPGMTQARMFYAHGELLKRLVNQAETGSEAQRLQADMLLSRAGRAWHGEESREWGRAGVARATVSADLMGLAPILAVKQVLVDRADRVMKERFEGGAEGAVEKVKAIDAKASTEASEELTAQLEGEPDAPELGDNPEVSPVSDARIAELEQQMLAMREQMVRAETQADTTLAQTSSTWQKIMGVLQGASSRKSALLTGAKSRLAALRKSAQARKAARRAEGRLSANPVEDFADDALIGASILAEGLVEFTNWSQALLREIGYRSGQDLRKLYAEASKKYLEALEAEKAAPTKTKGTPKQRAAREKINRAQRTAQNILDSLARRYSDPPIFDEGQRKVNAMRELYKERVRTGMAEAEFVAKAQALGANEGTSGILWEASKLEIDAREMMALEKSRAGLAAYLQKDSPALAKLLDALRKKMAPGMTWAEIFMTLPSEQKARQKEIYRRLMKDERLKALNQGERLQLTNELDRAWQRERRKVFMRELEKITGLGKTKKDKDKVKAALPRLLRLMNLGMLNSETFRGALAQEYGLKQIDAATGAELRKLGEQIQQAPEGLPRRKLEVQLLDRLQQLTGSTTLQLLESYWTAAVLSGWRTQVDIGLSLANGIEDVGLGSIITALRTGNKDVAWRAITELFKTLPQAMGEAWDHLLTGNRALMLNYQRDASAALEDGTRLAGDAGRELLRKGGWRTVPGFFMEAVSRMMQALDHINSNSTAAGARWMALARHPELYQKALAITAADRAALREQAKLEILGGTREPATQQERMEVQARVRELVSAAPLEILEEAREIGRQAALQGDPTGLGAALITAVRAVVGVPEIFAKKMEKHGVENAAGKLILSALRFASTTGRVLSGTKFIRTVGHAINRNLSYVPGIGLLRFAEGTMRGSRGDILIAKQLVGTVAGLAILAYFRDDEDDEKGIEGNWKDLPPERKSQLYAQGRQPNSVWWRNAQGRIRTVNYQQWGMGGIMATLGAMEDQRRYNGHNKSDLNILINGITSGAMSWADKAQLQGLQTILGADYRSTDPAGGFAKALNKYAAQTVGGLVPRIVKDVEAVAYPDLVDSSEWWMKWVKEMPMGRLLTNGNRVDILGKDIELQRGPLSRVTQLGTLDPAYRLLGRLNEQDVWLPDPSSGVRVVRLNDGTRREMTPLEKDRYQRLTGAAYRDYLLKHGEALLQGLKADEEAARDRLAKETKTLRDEAAARAVR